MNALSDPSYFGTMLVYKGLADGMVSGAINTTANTIRPSLEFIKTRPGTKIVSSVFLMLMEDRVLVYGDCAVNPNPNAEQLADIAKASAETARQFGVDPKVAMLSYSTGTSGSGADVDVVREATEIVRASNPDFRGGGSDSVRCGLEHVDCFDQDARQPSGGPGNRVHLPRPEHRQQHLQGCAAVFGCPRRWSCAAGSAQACERPFTRHYR